MFTDMVGYSALSQRNEALALELLAENQRLLRTQFPLFNGREVKTTGDGFLVEFPSALQATQCAVEIQRAVIARNSTQPSERHIQVRIGIHVGDVVHREADMYGDGVNIAARIEPLAIGGGICLSDTVYAQVRNKLEVGLTKLDSPDLKHIEVPMDVYRVVLPWEKARTNPERGRRNAESKPSLVTSAATKWAWIAAIALLAAGLGWWRFRPAGEVTNPIAITPARPPAFGGAASTPPIVAAAADQKSIAVLAFANLSEDKGNEYFSDGISEELLNVLAKVPGLKVAARTSAFYFKGKQVPMAEIAKQLGVAYVVEGSVRKSGTRVRITAQLIKAADGFHVWSDNFDRELKDIFAVQDEIAGLIAKNLQLKLADGLRVMKVVDPEAHRLLLEGRHFLRLRTAEGFDQAERAFTAALKIDPAFGLAQAGLADTTALRGRYRSLDGTILRVEEYGTLALAQSRLALQLDPALAGPHATMGFLLNDTWELAEAEQEFQRAIAADANYATAYHWHSHLVATRGQLDLALGEIGKAETLDPLSWIVLYIRGMYLCDARQYDQALAVLDRAAALRSERFLPLEGERVRVLFAVGRREEALTAARKLLQDSARVSPHWWSEAEALFVLQQGGAPGEAAAAARDLLPRIPAGSYRRGLVLCAMGNYTDGLPELNNLPAIASNRLYWNPMFDPVRDTPAFQQLLVKLNCVEEYKVARATLARMLKEQAAKK